ncbi:MAG: hypothetical protein PQJ58_11725 [Spirochaetales bacterium]|nr:hypothetical protein [Spirochaetales bacterium]
MKDYHDLLLLCRNDDVLNKSKLIKDISRTFETRYTKLSIPLSFSDDDLELLQKLWSGHCRGLGHITDKMELPDKIYDLINEINKWLIAHIPK